METASYKQRVAASFDHRSSSYDTSVFHQVLARRLLELAEVQPGQHVLDVATGTGLVALSAAHLVGQEGRVVGVDISQDMLRRARRLAASQELTNLTFAQGDADTLELERGRFDLILCCSALIYFTDIPRVLKHWHAALKPDGCVAFTCFADTAFLVPALLREYAAAYGVVLPSPNAPCGSPEQGLALVEAAGFRQPTIFTESVRYLWQFSSSEEAWPEKPYSPFTKGLEKLGQSDLATLKRRYVEGLAKLMPEGELSEEVPTFFVLARK